MSSIFRLSQCFRHRSLPLASLLICGVRQTLIGSRADVRRDYATHSSTILHPEPTPLASSKLIRQDTESGPALAIPGGGDNPPTILPGLWLRDQCPCPQCRNVETGQRKINVFKHPEAGRITQIHTVNDAFEVTFADGHKSSYGSEGFSAINRSLDADVLRTGTVMMHLWQSVIERYPPKVQYDSVQTGSGMAHLMSTLRQFGFCFVSNTPETPEATKALLESIGPIRNTHYGGFYDFTSDLSSKDTAYTSESLEPHTDNTYFTDPAGLQALHLLSHTEGSGGKSSLVDGFAAAHALSQQDPEAYRILCITPVFAHASGNEGISIQPAQPMPVLKFDAFINQITQVRWNNADRAGVFTQVGEQMEAWYRAAAKWDALISDPKNQYWFQLKPGMLLIFDNSRVLHGRSAFTGKRRMCGGYINRDDYISKYRMTNLSKEEIEASTVTG